jgi:coenzyme Q-binding protein COQ10
MAQAKIKQVFNAPIESVFKVISDYENYPEITPETKKVTILETTGEGKLVEFEIQVIKSFRYKLWMNEVPSTQISWKLHSGDMFKENFGGWTFKDLGNNTTEAEYSVNAKFGVFVPGMIEKKLIEVNLPAMMKAFKKRIENL